MSGKDFVMLGCGVGIVQSWVGLQDGFTHGGMQQQALGKAGCIEEDRATQLCSQFHSREFFFQSPGR